MSCLVYVSSHGIWTLRSKNMIPVTGLVTGATGMETVLLICRAIAKTGLSRRYRCSRWMIRRTCETARLERKDGVQAHTTLLFVSPRWQLAPDTVS
jgi:hypothetical protein